MDYDNTNKGAVWKNDKKETDRHPDFKGNINVEGVEYWVSGWKRGANDSPQSPAMRLAITKKDSQQASSNSVSPQAVKPMDDFDEFEPPF